MKNEFLNAESLKNDWDNNPRWKGITRNYSAEDVVSIRNSVDIKHTLAENGAQKLFENLNKKDEWISLFDGKTLSDVFKDIYNKVVLNETT